LTRALTTCSTARQTVVLPGDFVGKKLLRNGERD